MSEGVEITEAAALAGRTTTTTGQSSRVVECFLAGRVSRITLLSRLLPLSFGSVAAAVILGIGQFPESFDWRKEVISHLISARYNPEGYRIASVGLALGALLFLPFAGYVQGCLNSIAPLTARLARWSFTVFVFLIWSVVVSPPIGPGPNLWPRHEIRARTAGAAAGVAVACCCVAAFKDRFSLCGGRRRLRRKVLWGWGSLALIPVLAGGISVVMLVARKAEQSWALRLGDILRPTVFWQLAFWEWVGLALLYAFVFISVLWLPQAVDLPQRSEPE